MGEVFDGNIVQDERKAFIEQAQSARQKRAEVMQRQEAAIVITRFIRRAGLRRKYREKVKTAFLKLMETFDPEKGMLVTSLDVYEKASPLMKRSWKIDADCLELMCRYINWTATKKDPTYSYLGVGLIPAKALAWIRHLQDIVYNCLSRLKVLRPQLASEVGKLALVLSTLVNLTFVNKWPILSESKYSMLLGPMKHFTKSVVGLLKSNGFLNIVYELMEQALTCTRQFPLKRSNLCAIATLVNLTYDKTYRVDGKWKEMKDMILIIFSIPGYVNFIHSMCPEALDTEAFPEMVKCAAEENIPEEVNATDALCILGNFVQLGEHCGKLKDVFYPHFSNLINNLLWNNCLKKHDHPRHWHPILGWINSPVRESVVHNGKILNEQLAFLWGPAFQEAVFHPLYQFLSSYTSTSAEQNKAVAPLNPTVPSPASKSSKSSFLKAMRRVFSLEGAQTSNTATIRLNAEITIHVSQACKLYCSICSSFSL